MIHISTSNEIYVAVFSIAILVNTFLSIRDVQKNKKKGKMHKRLLFNEMINGYGNAATIFVIPVQLMCNIWNGQATADNMLLSAILSAMIVLYGLFTYIIRVIIPSKAEAYLQETYPGYDFSV